MGEDPLSANSSRSDPCRAPANRDAGERSTVDERQPGGDLVSKETPRALPVRCPHCHNQISLCGDEVLSNIECSLCGSHFSLVSDEDTATYHWKAGGTIDNFQLLQPVGVGRFGRVWKARDTELDRIVAIKVPRKGQLDTAETEQFVREARSAAQAEHPHIVTVHEVGRQADSVYIVTDFIDDKPVVRFMNGQKRLIEYHIWELEENNMKLGTVEQLPLKPGYAFSIHKSQGATLDLVQVDLEEVFQPGMGYVALSRVKDLESLSITGINWSRINAHPKATKFYKNL